MEEGACLIMVLAEIFRDGCCCSVSLLKFFGVGSAIKGSAVGGGRDRRLNTFGANGGGLVVVFWINFWMGLPSISGYVLGRQGCLGRAYRDDV